MHPATLIDHELGLVNAELFERIEKSLGVQKPIAACVAVLAGGVRKPRFGIPLKVMYALGFGGDIAAKVLRRDVLLSTQSVRLMHIMSPMDHSKAQRELDRRPEPIYDSIRRAVAFYRGRR